MRRGIRSSQVVRAPLSVGLLRAVVDDARSIELVLGTSGTVVVAVAAVRRACLSGRCRLRPRGSHGCSVTRVTATHELPCNQGQRCCLAGGQPLRSQTPPSAEVGASLVTASPDNLAGPSPAVPDTWTPPETASARPKVLRPGASAANGKDTFVPAASSTESPVGFGAPIGASRLLWLRQLAENKMSIPAESTAARAGPASPSAASSVRGAVTATLPG
jgi:hypothetical protein